MKDKSDYKFNLLLVGDSNTDKYKLMLRFIDDTLTPNPLTTLGTDFKFKYIKLCEKLIKLQIYEAASERFLMSSNLTYYRGVNGILLIYDVSDIN